MAKELRVNKVYTKSWQRVRLFSPANTLTDSQTKLSLSLCQAVSRGLRTAMDPSFRQWLSARNAPPKLLKKLEKEDIVNATTLSAMTDSDLESLQRKHKLPMGHAVILRSGRDELRRGKKVPSPSRSEDSFEVLASPVHREAPQGSATAPLLSPPPSYPARHGPRPTGEEIRSKYQGVRAPPRNGASAMPHSATPSPLPDTARTPTPAGGAGRLQV